MSTTKRFGARYGPSLKKKFAIAEVQQRSKHKCPSCNKTSVRRLSVGIWHCLKCKIKFAGKAYTI